VLAGERECRRVGSGCQQEREVEPRCDIYVSCRPDSLPMPTMPASAVMPSHACSDVHETMPRQALQVQQSPAGAMTAGGVTGQHLQQHALPGGDRRAPAGASRDRPDRTAPRQAGCGWQPCSPRACDAWQAGGEVRDHRGTSGTLGRLPPRPPGEAWRLPTSARSGHYSMRSASLHAIRVRPHIERFYSRRQAHNNCT
jgi:hypothetical protein